MLRGVLDCCHIQRLVFLRVSGYLYLEFHLAAKGTWVHGARLDKPAFEDGDAFPVQPRFYVGTDLMEH